MVEGGVCAIVLGTKGTGVEARQELETHFMQSYANTERAAREGVVRVNRTEVSHAMHSSRPGSTNHCAPAI